VLHDLRPSVPVVYVKVVYSNERPPFVTFPIHNDPDQDPPYVFDCPVSTEALCTHSSMQTFWWRAPLSREFTLVYCLYTCLCLGACHIVTRVDASSPRARRYYANTHTKSTIPHLMLIYACPENRVELILAPSYFSECFHVRACWCATQVYARAKRSDSFLCTTQVHSMERATKWLYRGTAMVLDV